MTIGTAIVLTGLGIVAILTGRWARRDTDRLVTSALRASDRAHKITVLRRGGLACYVAGGVIVVLAVASAL